MTEERREYWMMYHAVLSDIKKPMSDDELIEYLVCKCYDFKISVDYLLEKIQKINNLISEFKYDNEIEIEIENYNFDDLPF